MTRYDQAIEELKSRNDRLGALASMAGRIATYTDTRKLAREALQAAMDLLPVKAGIILLVSPATGLLEPHEFLNVSPETRDSLARKGWNNLIEAEVVRNRVPVLIRDLNKSDRVDFFSPEYLSLAIIPLISQERIIGTMSVSSAPPDVFDNADMEFLYALGSHVGIYLENARLYQELEKTNRELQAQNRDLEDLLSVISHDLRSPLATIGGYASLLIKKGESASAQERDKFARVIFKKTKETSNRLSDMLTFFRASMVSMESFKERVDVKDILIQSLEEAASEGLPEDSSINIPESLPVLVGNRNQLIHLFTNLISNALKFRDPTRPLEISVDHERLVNDSKISHRFTVSDNGIGISEIGKRNIFGLFKRGPGTEEIPGTGVGLAVIDRIISKNGGKIDVKSKPGKGSLFSFTLHWPEVRDSQAE